MQDHKILRFCSQKLPRKTNRELHVKIFVSVCTAFAFVVIANI